MYLGIASAVPDSTSDINKGGNSMAVGGRMCVDVLHGSCGASNRRFGIGQ